MGRPTRRRGAGHSSKTGAAAGRARGAHTPVLVEAAAVVVPAEGDGAAAVVFAAPVPVSFPPLPMGPNTSPSPDVAFALAFALAPHGADSAAATYATIASANHAAARMVQSDQGA